MTSRRFMQPIRARRHPRPAVTQQETEQGCTRNENTRRACRLSPACGCFDRPCRPEASRGRAAPKGQRSMLFRSVLGPAVTVGSPVYFENMVGDVRTFFDNWLLNQDRHLVNTDHCARRTPACFARKSSMLRPPARFGKCHLSPITAYPWISILASGTASAVMVMRALPGKLSPNTSRRICVRRSP
jgi:hypothetical protein